MSSTFALLLLLSGCTLPDSPDVEHGTVSVTWVGTGGAGHIVLACPPPPATP
jgi:hypothetical protein